MTQRDSRFRPGGRRLNPAPAGCRALGLALAACLVTAGVGCHAPADRQPETASPPSASPVLLVGIDGLEWDLLLPLVREGRLPHLEALMRRGRYGLLQTFLPTSSPVIWTTVATGKPAEEHGIVGFARREGRTARLHTNVDRRTKALWNILSDHDRRVAVVGWWMTFPVEPVNGVMVAQTNTVEQLRTRHGENIWKGRLLEGRPGQVFPLEWHDRVLDTLREADAALPALQEEIFGRFPHPLTELERRLWENGLWSFRADATYQRIALELLREEEPFDLAMVYMGSPDVVGHRFWRYMQPGLYADPPSPAQVENLGGVIADDYAWVDGALGRLVEAAGEGATVIVMSDHGMGPVRTEARYDPDDPPADVNSGHHEEAPPGVLIVAGPWTPATGSVAESRGELATLGTVYDIAPTVLALLRIPGAEDMRGRAIGSLTREEFAIDRQPSRVPTHDTGDFLASRPRLVESLADEEERLDQLRQLGYVE